MALIKSCLASGGGGFDIVALYNVYTASGTYKDITVTANVGDYLALNNSNPNAEISGTGVSETSEITITGALKIYKVTSALTSASLRVLMQSGNSGGAVLHIRNV